MHQIFRTQKQMTMFSKTSDSASGVLKCIQIHSQLKCKLSYYNLNYIKKSASIHICINIHIKHKYKSTSFITLFRSCFDMKFVVDVLSMRLQLWFSQLKNVWPAGLPASSHSLPCCPTACSPALLHSTQKYQHWKKQGMSQALEVGDGW